MDYDLRELEQLIENKNIDAIKKFMEDHNLQLKNNKIISSNNTAYFEEQKEFWQQRSHITKIKLNSLYGAITNPGSRFYDQRMGQSITLVGRNVAKHMSGTINQILTGVIDHTGDCIMYGDTDSLVADSIIKTTYGDITIEELFHLCAIKWKNDKKEYSVDDAVKIMTYNGVNKVFDNINYVYRHKVSKQQWEIEDEEGNIIKITNDHSVMIERDGILLKVKPADIYKTDLLITILDK